MPNRLLLSLLAAGALCACEPSMQDSSTVGGNAGVSPAQFTAAKQTTGTATVVDGDSLRIGRVSIRLHAVDAPEGRQTCTRESVLWLCGEVAAQQLRELVGRNMIVCTEQDQDNYGRSVAVCRNGSVDLGAEMVRAGLALAYREFGDDYVDEEAEARGERWFCSEAEARNAGWRAPRG
jgi:endonuclease YncB( thermonuclease family)